MYAESITMPMKSSKCVHKLEYWNPILLTVLTYDTKKWRQGHSWFVLSYENVVYWNPDR